MKRTPFLLWLFIMTMSVAVKAQSYEMQRLILDIQKLDQLKVLLTDVKKGYQILSEGYGAIKDLSEGNFSLHKVFLDGLLAVSPTIRNDWRATDIIRYEADIVAGCRAATRRFRRDKHIPPDDVVYLTSVYQKLLTVSSANLGHLLTILTDGQLRMNDAARLVALDGIYARTKNQWEFMRQFTDGGSVLSNQRASETNDIESTQRMLGLE